MGTRGPVAQLKLPAHLRAVPSSEEDQAPESAAAALPPLAPDKPKGLPRKVSQAWDLIVPELAAAGLVSKADALTLELALRHYAIAVKASNSLERSPVTIEDRKNGRKAKNPASQVMRDHSTAFLEFAKQLGMSFAARTRLPMPEGSDGDDDQTEFDA